MKDMQIKNFCEIFNSTHLPIHQRYSLLINNLSFFTPVLKTDLWNELNTDYPINADLFVEIDPLMVKKGKEKGLNAINSDIADLQIENESFNTVIDLSTIDHIEDPFPVFKEYHRILKKGKQSNCYIVCWLGNKVKEKMTNWDGWQYYFNETEFLKKLYNSGFYVETHAKFEGLGDDQCKLEFFHLKLQNKYFSFWYLYFQCFLKLYLRKLLLNDSRINRQLSYFLSEQTGK
jgi:SAM-dependent methyltransferase